MFFKSTIFQTLFQKGKYFPIKTLYLLFIYLILTSCYITQQKPNYQKQNLTKSLPKSKIPNNYDNDDTDEDDIFSANETIHLKTTEGLIISFTTATGIVLIKIAYNQWNKDAKQKAEDEKIKNISANERNKAQQEKASLEETINKYKKKIDQLNQKTEEQTKKFQDLFYEHGPMISHFLKTTNIFDQKKDNIYMNFIGTVTTHNDKYELLPIIELTNESDLDKLTILKEQCNNFINLNTLKAKGTEITAGDQSSNPSPVITDNKLDEVYVLKQDIDIKDDITKEEFKKLKKILEENFDAKGTLLEKSENLNSLKQIFMLKKDKNFDNISEENLKIKDKEKSIKELLDKKFVLVYKKLVAEKPKEEDKEKAKQ